MTDLAVPPKGKIYVQFEVYNETTGVFETLPRGVPIHLMDYNTVLPNKKLDTQLTDGQGRVEFETADLAKKAGEKPDIFFLAETKSYTVAGHTLPNEWSTKGWKTKDGQAGYYEDFTGTQLGDVNAPLVFRIGLDFHIKWTYQRPGHPDEIAPKGMPGYIDSSRIVNIDDKEFRTDADGEMHGVVFDVSPGDDISFHIFFHIEDASINLPKAKVDIGGWKTNTSDAGLFTTDPDLKIFKSVDRTSIGTKSSPEVIRASIQERNVAFYFLKILRELSTFLFHITDGA